jgi:hypothetical protein
MRRVASGLGSAAVLAAVVGIGWLGITMTYDVVQPISYVVVDARTVDVIAFTGANRGCRLESVLESVVDVTVDIRCASVWLSLGSTGEIRTNAYTVHLDANLADRDVVDGRGEPGRRCTTPRCEGDPLPEIP